MAVRGMPIRVPEAYSLRFGGVRVFITGVSCVGKTSIGAILASRLGCQFYDLDVEVRVTPGEIKTKTPRITRVTRICQKTLDQVLGPPVRYDGGWNAL